MKRLFLVFVLLFSASFAWSQAVSDTGGAISGDITDPSGAKLPGAVITITSAETGFNKTLKTDSAGFYSIGPLNPGHYTLKIVAQGFETLEVNTVIETGTATPGTFKLPIGNTSEVVEVNTGAIQVDTDQAGVSDVLTGAQLATLPVNGRNFLDMAQIEPGVILQAGSSFDPTKAGYSAISVSGVSGRTTRILLDGQDITDETVGTTLFNVSQGAIGEFQLNRATQDASGEVTSTGEVLVSTQTGTNTIHGMAFYNFQDYRALFADANVICCTTTSAGLTTTPVINPYFQRNQFGGSIGGPVLKDKLFLFANAERIHQVTATPAGTSSSIFPQILSQFPTVSTPYNLTYSTGRLDYNGPWGGHFFFRGAYNVDAAARNSTYELYSNRDNTFGFAGGADFQHGHFTHSFRGSYEKFHNLIVDTSANNPGVYDPIQGITYSYSGAIAFGPNTNTPQATYQSDKQVRYDGSWIFKQHSLRYGYSLNRILGGGFFAPYSLAPTVSVSVNTLLSGTVNATYNPMGYGCNNVVGAAACPNDPINGYSTSALSIGNGLGGDTEYPGFGLAHGGVFDWREGAYVQDTWKATPNLTFTAGVRWSVDTGRANQDLATPTCADISTTLIAMPLPCASGPTPLFSLWNPTYTQSHVHQSYGNFAPQVGLTYAPGSHKTVFRAGVGMFFENDVFNNEINSRSGVLKQALGYGTLPGTPCTNYSGTFADGTKVSTVNGVSLSQLCTESVAAAAPYFIALQQQYQANVAKNSSTNSAFVGNNLDISGQYAPVYRTPYAVQYNFGLQREIRRGAVLSADYVHNSTIHITQSLDQNHLGAARTFNMQAAQAAVNATLKNCGAASVQAAITPGGCATGSGSGTGGKYATLKDFASQGLDSAATFLSSHPYTYTQKTSPVAGAGYEQAAFPGINPLLGAGSFLVPIGRSGYDALQIVYKQQMSHAYHFITGGNFQGSYSLSRIVATATSSDEFFDPAVLDKDNPSLFLGRSSLDHKHEVAFGGSATFGGGFIKYGPRLALLAHFYSATPTNLTLDTASSTTGQIFITDVTGDGSTGDIAPGTRVGSYMHDVKPTTLGAYISNFNATKANTLTPAGQAVVNSGLFTQAQMIQIGAAIQPIAQVASGNNGVGVFNPAFRQFDTSFSWPIPVSKIFHSLREGIVLEPTISFYNVGNFSNFANDTGTLQNTSTATCTAASISGLNQGIGYAASNGSVNNCPGGGGYITGLNNLATQASKRTVRGIGTFDQGAQRTTEFQLHLNF